MVSSALSSVQKAVTQNLGLKVKAPLVHRAHYSGPSAGGGYHQHHHIYHSSSGGGGHGHSDNHGGKKRSIALSALTLLAFLFFLNILQNCLDEQMTTTTAAPSTQVVFLSAKQQKLKEAQKRLEDSKAIEEHGHQLSSTNYERINKKHV